MNLTVCGKTDQGLVRANNEDNFYLDEKMGLLVVADGMGGHASGEKASGLAVMLNQALHFANGQAPVAAVLQQRGVRAGLKAAHPEEVDQVVDGLASGFVERNPPRAVTFTGGGRQIQPMAGHLVEDVADVHAHHLGHPQARLGEEPDESMVASSEGGPGRDGGQQPVGGGRTQNAHSSSLLESVGM